jgi:hypothetical protein
MRVRLNLLAALLLSLLITIPAFASLTGDLQGTVLDPTGAVVPGAKVTIRNKATGVVKTVVSDQNGEFAALQLDLGDYAVTVEKAGLKTIEETASIRSAEKTRIDAKMEIGQSTETVSVEAAVPTLDVATAQLSESISAQTALDLPNQGRNPVQLATLSPGIVPVTKDNPFLGVGSFNSNGSRGRANNITIDNITSSDISTTGTSEFGTFSLDAIQEFKLITNNFDAEYGRNSGSQVQVITKGGSNNFHGDAYYFLQNRNFNARDYFDTTGAADPLVNNIGGFTFGGPIFKDHTFFFGHWELDRTRGNGSTRTATVLTPAQAAGITDPAAASIFKNDQVPTSANGQISAPAPNTTNAHSESYRIDQVLRGGKDNFYVRYGDNPSIATSPGLTFVAGNLPNFGAINTNFSRQLSFNYASQISNNLVDQFRFSFGRSKPGFQPLTTVTGNLGPQVSISGFDAFGESNIIAQGRLQNTFQYGDTLSWVHNKHSFKFGGDIFRYQAYSFFDSNLRGTATFSSVANFQAGIPTAWTQNFGNTNRHNFSTDLGFFAEDDYRLTDTITLNLGFRLDTSGGVSEENNILSNLNTNQQCSLGGGGTGALGCLVLGGESFARTWNPAPRLGVAWNPGRGKWVFRGGYGIAYDYLFLNPITNLRFAAPFVPSITVQNFSGGNSFDNLAAGTAPIQAATIAGVGQFLPTQKNFGSVSPVQLNLANPRNQQWDFGVEYQAPWQMILKTTYVGTHNDRLQATIPLNLVQTAVTPATSEADEAARLTTLTNVFVGESGAGNNRLDPRFNSVNQVQSVGTSNYDALQFEVVKNVTQGLRFDANYTWAHSLDDASDVLNVLVNDSPNLQDPSLPITANKGNSEFDIRNRFVMNLEYQVPFARHMNGWAGRLLDGFSIAPIFEARSGLPVTIFAGTRRGISDVFLDGNSVVRANGSFSGFQPAVGGTPFADSSTFTINGAGGKPQQLTIVGCQRGVNTAGNVTLFGTNQPVICTNTLGFGLTQPLLGNIGNSGRNQFNLAGLQDLDFAISKDNKITEKTSLKLRLEVFNALNHANFSQFVNNLTAATFGTYQGTIGQRQLQVSAKFVF